MGKVERTVEIFKQVNWEVNRTATVFEVHMDNGGIRFNVQVSDEGRKPFLSRWFNDPTPAMDLVEKMRGGGSG